MKGAMRTSAWMLNVAAVAGLLFCGELSAQQSVNLSAVDNVFGIANPGSAPGGGGLDFLGDAYAANLLGTSLTWAGETFTIAAAGPMSAARNRVIPLPAGKDASLSVLATGVDGNQLNQTFVVTYTDGSKTSFTQSLSDWFTPEHYAGESVALAMAYRITPTGAKQGGPFNVYGYTFALNSAKTVQSLTLPANGRVVVVAADVTPVVSSSPVTLSAIDNVYGIANPGSAPTGGGLDSLGYAYAANLLGTSLTWAGETFSIAAAGPMSAARNRVIPLPAGKDVSLSVLATGVDGNQLNQTFVVTYTDGSKTSFTQSLSDWFTPKSYAGESVALTMPYRITPTGTEQAGPFNVYGYTFALNSTKTVQSLTLPANGRVVVLAIDVTPAAGGGLVAATPTFNHPAGSYMSPQLIALADSTSGAAIYYTTDGSVPTQFSTRYTSPIGLSGSVLGNSVTTTIKAIAVATGFTNSAVASATYTITLAPAATPAFSPPAGIYGPQQLVSLTDSIAGATIYYSIDGNFGSPRPLLNVYSGPLALQGGSVNRVNAEAAADGFAYSPIVSAVYDVPAFPSDLFPGGSPFLYNNSSQQDSCAYYAAAGAFKPGTAASTQCDMVSDPSVPNGMSFVHGITFASWLSSRFTPLESGGLHSSATFVNAMDLNFTRLHQAVMNAGASAAYVCNYPGPDFYHSIPAHIRTDSPAVDQAIHDATLGKNPLACVAMDYGINTDAQNQPLNSGQPFLRFLVFSPAGNLLDAVDLDGRGAKKVPNACSACHGVPFGAAASGSQSPLAASYIPFDEGNLLFSNVPGLTVTDQEGAIKNLNLIVLNGAGTNTGGALYDLIHGWYDTSSGPLTSPTQQLYVPAGLASPPASLNDSAAYESVYAPFCRSCHVANGVQFGTLFPPTTPQALKGLFQGGSVCSPSGSPVMPNARVTFDRFWTTHVQPSATLADSDLPAFLATYLGGTCDLPTYNPYPNQIP